MSEMVRNKRKKHKRMSAKERIILAVVIVVGIIAIAFLGWKLLMNWRPFNHEEQLASYDFNNSYVASSDETGQVVDQYDLSNQVNILCLGFDESGSLSDVMLLVSLDKVKKTVQILQIPRDCYISDEYGDPYWSTGKINAAYELGGDEPGINNLTQVIYDQFKLPVDHYVYIGTDDIVEIVDKMGGIPINVPETIYYESGKTIWAGEQVLEGYQAEWFVRYRHGYANGDLGRQQVQRIFFAACVKQAKSMGVSQVVDLIPTLADNLSTDMSVGEMKELAPLFLDVDMSNYSIHMVPGEGVSYGGYDVYSMHDDETADMLNQYFRPYQMPVSVYDLSIFEIQNTSTGYDDVTDDFQTIIDGKTDEDSEDSEDIQDSEEN